MSTIAQVCAAIRRTVTTAAELAGRESGLVQRRRKLSGDKLAQVLVFGWLNQTQATLEQLSQGASQQHGMASNRLGRLSRKSGPLWSSSSGISSSLPASLKTLVPALRREMK